MVVLLRFSGSGGRSSGHRVAYARIAPRTDQPPCPSRRRCAQQPVPAVPILRFAPERQSIVPAFSPSLSPLDEMKCRNLVPSRGLPRCPDKELHFQLPSLQTPLDGSL